MNKAVEYFQKAIDKQPDWAPAYAGQAHAYHELSWYRRPNEVMPKARMSAEKSPSARSRRRRSPRSPGVGQVGI